jgi:hypothetical protein
MPRLPKRFFLSSLVALAGCGAAAPGTTLAAAESANENDATIAARLGCDVVRSDEVDAWLDLQRRLASDDHDTVLTLARIREWQQHGTTIGNDSVPTRADALRAIVTRHLIAREAERLGVDVSDALLTATLDALADANGVDVDDLRALVVGRGAPYEAWLEMVRDEQRRVSVALVAVREATQDEAVAAHAARTGAAEPFEPSDVVSTRNQLRLERGELALAERLERMERWLAAGRTSGDGASCVEQMPSVEPEEVRIVGISVAPPSVVVDALRDAAGPDGRIALSAGMDFDAATLEHVAARLRPLALESARAYCHAEADGTVVLEVVEGPVYHVHEVQAWLDDGSPSPLALSSPLAPTEGATFSEDAMRAWAADVRTRAASHLGCDVADVETEPQIDIADGKIDITMHLRRRTPSP